MTNPEDTQRPLEAKAFTHSENFGELAKALATAQGAFKPVYKNRTAKIPMKAGGQYSYKYADLSDVMDAVKEALSANGLAIVQTTDGICLFTMLVHSSGQWLQGRVPLIWAEGGGPQQLGSALTYARRYGVCCLLGVVADEDDDGEVAQDQTNARAPHSNENKARSAPKPSGPNDYPWEKELASDAQRKKLYAMTKSLEWEPAKSADFIKKATGKNSSDELTKGEIQAVFLLLEGEQAKLGTGSPK